MTWRVTEFMALSFLKIEARISLQGNHVKRSKQEIIQILRDQNYAVTQFSLRLEGKYSIDDASWNYRDAIAHLSLIHPQVKNIPIVADEDKLASVFLQRIFGIRFPIGVVDYETSPYTQTTFFAWGFFIIVVENVCRSVLPNRAEVITDYHICSPRLFRPFHPLIRWILKRNYQLLMSQDVPMRERRGVLREWGYRFKSEDENRSYLKALNIGLDLVEPPSQNRSDLNLTIDIDRDLLNGEKCFFGRDDHSGVQVHREGETIKVFSRMCPHQGASLDDAAQVNGKLKCSWHGRLLSPLVSVRLSECKDRPIDRNGFHFEVTGQLLRLSKQETNDSEESSTKCLEQCSHSKARISPVSEQERPI